MGNRSSGFISFKQDFIFPDQETYDEFADTVLNHFSKVVAFHERKFADRGIECLNSDEPLEITDISDCVEDE